MAYTNLAVTTLTGGTTLNAAVSMTAVDQPNGNCFTNDGETLLKVTNGGGSSIDVTITSVADPVTGRTGNIVQAVAAGATRYFGFFARHLFNQTSGVDVGKVRVDFSSGTSVTAAAIRHA